MNSNTMRFMMDSMGVFPQFLLICLALYKQRILDVLATFLANILGYISDNTDNGYLLLIQAHITSLGYYLTTSLGYYLTTTNLGYYLTMLSPCCHAVTTSLGCVTFTSDKLHLAKCTLDDTYASNIPD